MIVHLDTTKWLTPTQYAEKHGVQLDSVLKWIKRGNLKSKHIKEWNLRLINSGEVPSTRQYTVNN